MIDVILVLYGPQGSGKGTQAELLAKETGMKAFSMGEALRDEIKNGTQIGLKIQSLVQKGDLVPADMTNQLLDNAIKSAKGGIIIDGYPRNKEQMDYFSKHFKTDIAIELTLTEHDSVERISTRRVCPKCSRNYNIKWLKPKIEDTCDICNVALKKRDDDKPAEVKKRLEIYRRDTLPMRDYFKSLGVLHTIDASQSIEDVHRQIMATLPQVVTHARP